MRRWGVGAFVVLVAALVASCGTIQGVTAVDAGDAATPPPADDASSMDASNAAAYAAAVLADGPLLYLHFDDTRGATAAAAAGPSGTISGAVAFGQPGAVGAAFGFDGFAGERVEVGANGFDFVGTAPFTLEAWVRVIVNDPDFRHVFVKDTDGTAPREEYGLLTHAGDITFERFVQSASRYISVPLATDGKWRHVVGTYDGMSLRLFVDAKLADSIGDVREAGTKTTPLRIGAKTDTDGVVDADLDEIAVYGTALSPARIAAHFQAATGRMP